jgi:hypothetical protein
MQGQGLYPNEVGMSSKHFSDFDKWMRDMLLDPDDLNKPYYSPDLRVAFIEGRTSGPADSLAGSIMTALDIIRAHEGKPDVMQYVTVAKMEVILEAALTKYKESTK